MTLDEIRGRTAALVLGAEVGAVEAVLQEALFENPRGDLFEVARDVITALDKHRAEKHREKAKEIMERFPNTLAVLGQND